MRLLGAKVHEVTTGTGTLKDAVSEAMSEWTNRIEDTHYVLGSCMGPHPFPTIVRDFQAVISKEIKEQMLEKEDVFRTQFSPVSAADLNAKSAHSTTSSRIRTFSLSAARQQDAA